MEDAIQPQMGLNFEQVWAALMETRASIQELREEGKETDRFLKESKAETDRRFQELAEQHKETERFLKESKAETDRFLKESKGELNKAMGKLTNKLGELVEHLVSPNLLKKFNALG
ncbi:MAG: hypothetical protein LBF60_06575, partial [Treponema sp.]|nr:hypothetical protein [Treponema sp.]